MTVVNVPVLNLLGSFPAMGLVGWKKRMLWIFYKYCQIVLCKLCHFAFPPAVQKNAPWTSSPALSFHFCQFCSWKMAYYSFQGEFLMGGFSPHCLLENCFLSKLFYNRLWNKWDTEHDVVCWGPHHLGTPSSSPLMFSAPLNFCPNSLNYFPALWAGLYHVQITPRSLFPPPSDQANPEQPDPRAPCQKSSSNKGKWLLVGDGTEMSFCTGWGDRLHHILDLFLCKNLSTILFSDWKK